MKSAGVSLLRVMRPAIYLAIFTSLFSIFASNYLKPVSTFQFKKRFDLIRKQKSTLSIEEGIFNNDFNNFVIRVGKKEKNKIDVKDVWIYDHSQGDKSLINMIKSDSAQMFATDDGKYFVMNLVNGNQYQEQDRNRVQNGRVPYGLIRTSFEKWSKVIDMSNFYLSESDLNISRNREDMLNSFQLMAQIDTINASMEKYKMRSSFIYNDLLDQQELTNENYIKQLERSRTIITTKNKVIDIPKASNQKSLSDQKAAKSKDEISTENAYLIMQKSKLEAFKKKEQSYKNNEYQTKYNTKINNTQPPNSIGQSRDSTNKAKRALNYDVNKAKSFAATFDSFSLQQIISRAVNFASANSDQVNATFHNIDHSNFQKQIYILRLGQQYSFALVCIIFLFIGAPLGSIIRKGGYGYPLLVAILFYILFMITTIVGEKLLKTESIPGWLGAWLPCLILLPFSIYFTYLALNDVRFAWINKFEQTMLNVLNKVAKYFD